MPGKYFYHNIMNLRIFLFKLLAIIILTLKLMLIFTPVVLALRAMRATDFYFVDEVQAALFISFGLGMAVTIYNAFEFENFQHLDLTQYLKTHQHHSTRLSDQVSAENLLPFIEKKSTEAGYKMVSKSSDSIEFEFKSPYKFKDKVMVRIQDHDIIISSKPKNRFWPIDLGRNYKNILSMLLVIKQRPISS